MNRIEAISMLSQKLYRISLHKVIWVKRLWMQVNTHDIKTCSNVTR